VISIHLSDQELTAAAAGERDRRTAHHLQICGECQQQLELHRERMESLRQDVVYSAGRSAIEWGKQSRAIQQGILASEINKTQRSGAGFAVAMSALAAVLVLALLLGFRDTPPEARTRQAATGLSDAALMSDVEAELDEELPDALQPASLLVGEMGGLESDTTSGNNSHGLRNAQ